MNIFKSLFFKKRAKLSSSNFKNRLHSGLRNTRESVWGRVFKVFSSKISEESLATMEEILYASDLGPTITTELLANMKRDLTGKDNSIESARNYLYEFLKLKMKSADRSPPLDLENLKLKSGTQVIMVTGVNGSGKTTTVGKLAYKLAEKGAKVVVGACDTFRAGAVSQLEIWAKRGNVEFVSGKDGQDGSGVAFDAVKRAYEIKADFCFLDTAGRLHTKLNLMEELKKNKRVVKKIDESAPHHTLLVVDAISGINAIKQGEEFHSALSLDGIVVTKCDGSSKAGSVVSIVSKLKLPIYFIGVGESADDIDTFRIDEFLNALLGE